MISSVFLENIVTWMGINLVLAIFPMVLSLIIFRKSLWVKHIEHNVLAVSFRIMHILAMLRKSIGF